MDSIGLVLMLQKGQIDFTYEVSVNLKNQIHFL